MEPTHATHEASASKEDFDFISRMPGNVITNILNRLPVEDAVGTSILSRKWRFKWILLTQLVFDVFLLKEKDYDLANIISRLLLHLRGPITKFVFKIPLDKGLDFGVHQRLPCLRVMDGTNKAPKSASEEEEEFISTMPENVITNILNRLPIQNAVGTSILSRNWRFKWTLLTQLVFDVALRKQKDYDLANIISRLLLHLIGPITKFVLSIPHNTELDVDHILSRKGLKEFTLSNYQETQLKLSSHLFSCLELKHLDLYNCVSCPPPNYFNGFPNLLSIDLYEVTEIDNCMKFITKCPLLEILKITAFGPIGKVKLVEILKFKNLTVLSLPLSILDDVAITRSTICQLGSYHPKLQELTLDFHRCTFLGEAGVRKPVCTAFPCLKTLTLNNIAFESARMLSFSFEMIWGLPNLQTLAIVATYNGDPVPPPAFSFPEADNNTKLQLQNVDFTYFRGSENEEYMIKSLLACSPLLQSITFNVFM